MQTTKLISGGTRRGSTRVVAWVLLFAFALQCYATQIHIHGSPLVSVGVSAGIGTDEAGRHGKSPVAPDPATCPICQAIAHTGLFFTPAPPLLFLPAWVAHIALPMREHAISRAAPTHDWLSRAPPRN